MANIYSYHSISPVRIEHGLLTDTAIAIYDFDPINGGYTRNSDNTYSTASAVTPQFSGELIAHTSSLTTNQVTKLYIAYDSGSGLEWKQVVTNSSNRLNRYDSRTGDIFDSRFEERCQPPWLCE